MNLIICQLNRSAASDAVGDDKCSVLRHVGRRHHDDGNAVYHTNLTFYQHILCQVGSLDEGFILLQQLEVRRSHISNTIA